MDQFNTSEPVRAHSNEPTVFWGASGFRHTFRSQFHVQVTGCQIGMGKPFFFLFNETENVLPSA